MKFMPYQIAQYRQNFLRWIRFGIIGATANAIGFCLYLLLTAVGIRPTCAVTIVFIINCTYTFWLNKRFVFRNFDIASYQFLRYLLIYIIAWALNLAILDYLISQTQLNHVAAQALLICLFAVLIFVAQKRLVFLT